MRDQVNHANMYCSKEYKRYNSNKTKVKKACVGFKRTGRAKNGFKVKKTYKGAQFLDRGIGDTQGIFRPFPLKPTTESPSNNNENSKPSIKKGCKLKKRRRGGKLKCRRNRKKNNDKSTKTGGIFTVPKNEKTDSLTPSELPTKRRQRHRNSRKHRRKNRKRTKQQFGKNLFS